MQRILVVVGVVLLVVAGAWRLFGAREWNNRYNDDWSWEVDTLGVSVWADETTGEFPPNAMEDDPINITQRTITVAKFNTDDNTAEIEDYYTSRDPATNAVVWEFTYEAMVDAETGKLTSEPNAGDYLFFPRQVEKKTYTISNSSYQSIPMSFVKEEKLAGLDTYLFSYRDNMNNTVAYSDVTLEEGQTIICFDFELDYWVEPTTGEIVKYREWCPGDYVVDVASNERLYPLSRWGGETSSDDLIRRSDVVKSELNDYKMATLYIPLGLAIVGVVLIVGGLATMLMKKSE
jgi:hypothetical protein